MQSNNRLLDDIARIASGAVGAAAGVRTEIEALIKDRLQRVLSESDLVPREEFEVVKAMATKARMEQEAMAERIARLESEIAQLRARTTSQE